MKALTVSQPFASLIASGEKWIENRSWKTNYRGLLAIHAGVGTQYMPKKELARYPNGCIIAVGELAACVRLSEIKDRNMTIEARNRRIAGTERTWGDADWHPHAEGPYCWILDRVRRLNEPIKAVGKQGMWNIDPAIIDLVMCD